MRKVSYWGKATGRVPYMHDNLPCHTNAEPNNKFIIPYFTRYFKKDDFIQQNIVLKSIKLPKMF